MRHSVFFYFIIFFVCVSFIGGSVFTTYSQFTEEGPLAVRKEIVIPKGKTVKTIAKILYDEGVINSPSIFVLGVRASGNAQKLKAGEYSFPPRASAKMVMNIMAGGQTYIRRIVVPEGLTSGQVVALLDEAVGLVGVVSQIPKNGTLLPETYHYSYGDTKESMLVRMQNAMRRVISEEWPNRAEGLPFDTPEEAVTLASIVEKETSIDRERAQVAAVFVNRLNKKMRLQSDPTVIFAVTDGRVDLKRALTYADLRVPHSHNTYVIPGLPAGPIANPGRKSIHAVLHPADSQDIYFVADGTGGHVFAATYSEHQKNVQAWRQVNKNRRAAARRRAAAKTAQTAPVKTTQQSATGTAQNITAKTAQTVPQSQETDTKASQKVLRDGVEGVRQDKQQSPSSSKVPSATQTPSPSLTAPVQQPAKLSK